MSLSHDVVASLKTVVTQIQQSVVKHNVQHKVRLLAVSKTKPPAYVEAAYAQGQRHFGENYVNELVDKAPACPADIKWHFIGHLQSNKCLKVAKIPNLYMVECVDSTKLASKLDKACEQAGRTEPLKVLIQVNTSGEASKSGCEPTECVDLVGYVVSSCPHLRVAGLMTIGAYEADPTPTFFQRLQECKRAVCDRFPELCNDFELSMGMSHDYDLAIENGSTEVRVGTAIFGPRSYIKSSDDE